MSPPSDTNRDGSGLPDAETTTRSPAPATTNASTNSPASTDPSTRDHDIPLFGTALADKTYVLRPGSYALIRDAEARLAIVRTPEGCFLPGGGAEAGETVVEALVREVREECGLVVDAGVTIGTADQLVDSRAEAASFRKRCTFLVATVRERLEPREIDHELLWLDPDEARRSLRDASQVWAIDRLIARDGAPDRAADTAEQATSTYATYSEEKSDFEPVTHQPGFEIRMAGPDDARAIAELIRDRHGGPLEPRLEFVAGEIERGAGARTMFHVAVLDGRVIGYAKASHWAPAADAPSNAAPEGWYLLGVIVHPEFRRRGAGLALTTARLQWIAQRSDRAYYFANIRNRVSIELHRALGFVEVTRDFHVPGLSFTGGVGALFVVRLPVPVEVLGRSPAEPDRS